MKILVMVLINNHAYRMSRDKAKKMINMIKKEKKGTNTILAIEKDNIFEMRKDNFNCANDLLSATQIWLKKGYKVYSVKSLS